MTSGIKSKGVDLDSIFSPYQSGTTQQRATGIKVNGQDLNARYANIVYGSAVAATGIDSEGADLNTLFCTGASYALPINGQTFDASGVTSGSGAVSATASFQINASTWTVTSQGTNSPLQTLASGPTPAGATTIQIVDTWLNATGDTDNGVTTNTCPTYTAIPSSSTVGCSVAETSGHSGTTTGQTTHSLLITMKSSSGQVISTTTIYTVCVTSKG